MINGQFYTVQDIEQMFDWTGANVYRLIKTGQLEAVKFGGRYVIERKALEQFKQSRKRGSNNDSSS